MDITKQIKFMLVEREMTVKELGAEIERTYGTKQTLSNLSQKINRGKMSFEDVQIIAKILGYKIKFEKE